MFSFVFAGNIALFSKKGRTEKESLPYKMTRELKYAVRSRHLSKPYILRKHVCGDGIKFQIISICYKDVIK